MGFPLPQKPAFDAMPQQASSSANASASENCGMWCTAQQHAYAFCAQLTIAAPPSRSDILYQTSDAEQWQWPRGCPPESQIPENLPYFRDTIANIRHAANEITEVCRDIDIIIKTAVPPRISGAADSYNSQLRHLSDAQNNVKRTLIGVAVCIYISGPSHAAITNARAVLYSKIPINLRAETVALEPHHYCDGSNATIENIHTQLQNISTYSGAQIFVVKPKESEVADQDHDCMRGKMVQIKIFGDYESVELAKTRVLLMIEDLLGNKTHEMLLEVSAHPMVAGKGNKNIKAIEKHTNTRIYFPPSFPGIYSYRPPNGRRRHPDQIFITGPDEESLLKADTMLRCFFLGQEPRITTAYTLSPLKLDMLVSERLYDIKKIMEITGTHVTMPTWGSGGMEMTVQGIDDFHVDKALRAVLNLNTQYYEATWWVRQVPEGIQIPSAKDFQGILMQICATSGSEIGFHDNCFFLVGNDWAVRRAMGLIQALDYARSGPLNQVRFQLEIPSEEKEFVTGKKLGKMNKIVQDHNVEIQFKHLYEYSFYLEVVSNVYEDAKAGLELTENELPASLSFHVPDEYHRKIIGVGGSGIQYIMKKYSVFVKFSNAMERGMGYATGKENMDLEDPKMDNVVCKTPARNSTNLDPVKQEIIRKVKEYTNDVQVIAIEIPRLQHQKLIVERADAITALEKEWDCQIIWPSSENASDFVNIKGPSKRLTGFTDGLLALVPQKCEIKLLRSSGLEELLKRADFYDKVVVPIKTKYNIDLEIGKPTEADIQKDLQPLVYRYNRNCADYIEMVINITQTFISKAGITCKIIEGGINKKPNPYDEFASYFDSAVFQQPRPRPSSSHSSSLPSSPGSRMSNPDLRATFTRGASAPLLDSRDRLRPKVNDDVPPPPRDSANATPSPSRRNSIDGNVSRPSVSRQTSFESLRSESRYPQAQHSARGSQAGRGYTPRVNHAQPANHGQSANQTQPRGNFPPLGGYSPRTNNARPGGNLPERSPRTNNAQPVGSLPERSPRTNNAQPGGNLAQRSPRTNNAQPTISFLGGWSSRGNDDLLQSVRMLPRANSAYAFTTPIDPNPNPFARRNFPPLPSTPTQRARSISLNSSDSTPERRPGTVRPVSFDTVMGDTVMGNAPFPNRSPRSPTPYAGPSRRHSGPIMPSEIVRANETFDTNYGPSNNNSTVPSRINSPDNGPVNGEDNTLSPSSIGPGSLILGPVVSPNLGPVGSPAQSPAGTPVINRTNSPSNGTRNNSGDGPSLGPSLGPSNGRFNSGPSNDPSLGPNIANSGPSNGPAAARRPSPHPNQGRNPNYNRGFNPNNGFRYNNHRYNRPGIGHRHGSGSRYTGNRNHFNPGVDGNNGHRGPAPFNPTGANPSNGPNIGGFNSGPSNGPGQARRPTPFPQSFRRPSGPGGNSSNHVPRDYGNDGPSGL